MKKTTTTSKKQTNKLGFLHQYIKFVTENRNRIFNLIEDFGANLYKLFYLDKLEQIGFFKKLINGIRIFTKWSTYTYIFGVFAGIIDNFIGFGLDIKLWFGILYGVWLVIYENIFDLSFENYSSIKSFFKNLLTKVYEKLGSKTETVQEAEKIKMFTWIVMT